MAVFRWLVAGATALAVVGVVGYRVLAPHDTLTVAQRPYPAAEVAPFLRIGVLTSAPLIVDNRIRVYAEKSRVWADSPVSSRTQLSPFWAYRRWPAALVGVMAVESVPVVVSRWSDGALVALDARTGRVAWRSRISPGGRYTGRRTGSATVYSPVGLYTARSAADGTPVVVADGRAFDARTGRPLWTVPRGCDTWTTATAYVVADCTGGLVLYDAGDGRPIGAWRGQAAGRGRAAGRLTPFGCALGHSGCELFEAGQGFWRIGHDAAVSPEPWAHAMSDLVLGDTLVESEPDQYVALVDRATGVRRWVQPVSGRVVAVDASGVYVVTRAIDLSVLDLATGMEDDRLGLRGTDTRAWTPGRVELHDGFIAIERITGRPRDGDDRYFYGGTPVVLAGI